MTESPDLPFLRGQNQKHHLFLGLLVKAYTGPAQSRFKVKENKLYFSNNFQPTLHTYTLIIIATLKGRHYFLHFIKEETLTVMTLGFEAMFVCFQSFVVVVAVVVSQRRWGFPSGSVGKNPLPMQEPRRHSFDLWVGKIPWRRKSQSTPVFLPG